jgi:hypothetical protein
MDPACRPPRPIARGAPQGCRYKRHFGFAQGGSRSGDSSPAGAALGGIALVARRAFAATTSSEHCSERVRPRWRATAEKTIALSARTMPDQA